MSASCRPIRSSRPTRALGPASSRTCRRASRCRRPTTGAPTGPATSVPASPTARCSAGPGPNVGYAYTLAQRAKDRLRLGPSEHADDAIAVIAEIAGKRAAQFGRAPVIGDVDLAIALLGYDGSASEAFVKARSALVHEAGHDVPAPARARRRGSRRAAARARADDRPEIESWRASMRALAASG